MLLYYINSNIFINNLVRKKFTLTCKDYTYLLFLTYLDKHTKFKIDKIRRLTFYDFYIQ